AGHAVAATAPSVDPASRVHGMRTQAYSGAVDPGGSTHVQNVDIGLVPVAGHIVSHVSPVVHAPAATHIGAPPAPPRPPAEPPVPPVPPVLPPAPALPPAAPALPPAAPALPPPAPALPPPVPA